MDSYGEIWSGVSAYCRERMTEVAHNLWIRDIVLLSFENDTAYLGVKSAFKQNLVIEKYSRLLGDAFESILGFPVAIDVSNLDDEPKPKEEEKSPAEPVYTFENFIVGPSNKFAHAASVAVATHEGSSYNPLFIYGDSGLGKSHLLFAIQTEVEKRNPNAVVTYVKSEAFTNELISSIQNQTMPEFRDKYRHSDYLLVDDIQFIAGKVQTQEEFFHTFNSLYEANKQIVLTSDRPPKEIKTLEDRLRTRFESGLLADIEPPDFETRIAIIQRKAKSLDITLPDDVVEFVATKLKNNIRQLEGAVKSIKANSILLDTPPSIIIAQTAIRDILSDNQPVPVTIDKIISEVARTYQVSAQDIRSTKRAANISNARQIAIYIVREITQMSMAAIGDEFGGRDHSTVVYAVRQVEELMERDSRAKETIEDIIKNIRDS